METDRFLHRSTQGITLRRASHRGVDSVEGFREGMLDQGFRSQDNPRRPAGGGKVELRPPLSESALIAFARALDLREHGEVGHSERVAQKTLRLCEIFGFSAEATADAYVGALLHDIGMLAVPEAVIRKTGPLTASDWDIVRRHPTQIREYLTDLDGLEAAVAIPYFHHECMNGGGYPLGLQGDAIPLAARLFAVVHTWEALTHRRPYREAWGSERARAYLTLRTYDHFDPEVVHAFLALHPEDGGTSGRPTG